MRDDTVSRQCVLAKGVFQRLNRLLNVAVWLEVQRLVASCKVHVCLQHKVNDQRADHGEEERTFDRLGRLGRRYGHSKQIIVMLPECLDESIVGSEQMLNALYT